jgi:hypothetical protein
MRQLARGYSIHLRSRAALIHRNGDFGIELRRKAYLFGFLVCYEHFLHECSRRALQLLPRNGWDAGGLWPGRALAVKSAELMLLRPVGY